MSKSIRMLAEAAIIAALYCVLSVLLWQFSSLGIQVRVSESLIMLTCFTGAAVPGLTVGCILANLFMGNLIDAVFGSLATLLGALLGRLLAVKAQKKNRPKAVPFLAPVPNVLLNALMIPFVLVFGYGVTSFGSQTSLIAVLSLQGLSVFIGEVLSCYVLGLPVYFAVKRIRGILFQE